MVTDRDLLDFSGHVTVPEQPKGKAEAVVIGLRKCPYQKIIKTPHIHDSKVFDPWKRIATKLLSS